MADVLRDDVGETREPLAAAAVSVDGGELAPRGDQVAELGLGDASRVVGCHSLADEISSSAFYMECELVVDVLFDGAARNAGGAADLGHGSPRSFSGVDYASRQRRRQAPPCHPERSDPPVILSEAKDLASIVSGWLLTRDGRSFAALRMTRR